MSLNGLDNVKVKEAHDAAIAEPGGWFLLKYVSRDEVELMGRGNAGIVEIRNAIANYEEDSPLFGFLRYRRRNVIIKFVPESCSRLVQARVTVHFNAVTERLSPHDTVFPIKSAKELRDTSLSNACSLHTASGSVSSSTSSLRRRRLMEIAEDADEDKRASVVVEERSPTAKIPSVSELQSPQTAIASSLQSPGQESAISFISTITDTDAPALAALRPSRTSDGRPRSPTKEIEERRKSLQSTGPELHNYSSHTSSSKPKVKLGPRPSLDITGRTHTSTSNAFRPVSTLPAGLKLFSRSPQKSKDRPQSQHPTMAPSMIISPPPIPGDDTSNQTISIVRPHTSGGRPNSSSGASVKVPPSSSISVASKPAMTPEKARLMKALNMRKKKMSEPVQSIQPETSLSPPPFEYAIVLEGAEEGSSSQGQKEAVDSLDDLSDMATADSLFVDTMGGSQTTRTSSNPTSPVDPSEAESTQASSISESTDETTRPAKLKEQDLTEANVIAKSEQMTTAQDAHDKLRGQLESKVNEVQHEEAQNAVKSVPTPETKWTDKERLAMISSETSTGMDGVKKLAVEQIPPTKEVKIPEQSDISEIIEGGEQNIPLIVEEMLPRSTYDGDFSSIRSSPLEIEDNISRQSPITQESQAPGAPAEDLKVTMQDLLDAADKSSVREWKIPRSKFSVQDLKADDIPIRSASTKSPVGSTFSIESKRSFTDDELEEGSREQTRKKRKGIVEPILTDFDHSANNSESELDDDLMDELQSAQVQEAKPIMVSKSPITPVSPTHMKKSNTADRFSRAFSNPFSKDDPKSQEPTKFNIPSRSVSASATYLNRINQQQSVPIATKVNLGSGISQRIKALEKLSSASPNTTTPTAGLPITSPSFYSVRKAAGGRQSPSIAERAESLTKNSPSPPVSRESSPETFKPRDRSESTQSRTNVVNAPLQNSPSKPPSRSRPESISVTARIVRDPNQPLQLKPEMPHKDPLDYAPLDLKQSPLVIDHQKAITVSQPLRETILERRLSKPEQSQDPIKKTARQSKESLQESTKKERRSSITVIKDFISEGRNSISERRSSFSGSRKSISLDPAAFSSLKSPSRPPSTHANSPNTNGRPGSVSSRRSNSSKDLSALQLPSGSGPMSMTSAPPTPNDDEAKKASRARTMLRRMSSSISNSRKTLAHAISPTVREEFEPPQTGKQSLTPSRLSQSSVGPIISVEIGDVNVQFPDTLLWKRRAMSLDNQGYLQLSQAQGNKGMEKTMVNKRYHLSEFKAPFVPEMESQELPNSVVLDFIEGSGLQIACEDRGGQTRVLQAVQEAHRIWASYGR